MAVAGPVKRRVWLVDVDGTVALREEGGRGPYDWDRVGEDLPHEPVVHLVQSLILAHDRIIFMSGRNEVCRHATWHWLQAHVICSQVWENAALELVMRPDTDEWRFASDDELKRWLYETVIEPVYDVIGVLDDRDRVVKMWRSLGLTCLQVAEGDF